MSFQSFLRAVGRVARARDGRIAIVGILAIVLLLVQSGLGQFVLRAAGLSRSNSSFVELYFPDSHSLPATLPKSDRLDVRFAIGNISSTTRTLAWQITATRDRAQVVLGSGRSVVPANRTRNIARNIRALCSGKRAQLAVAIEGSSARINLWLACPKHR